MVEKEAEIIVLLLPLCYTVREIRAASAMTRLEAHFFKRSQQERDKKTIRAANGILKPRKIRACKTRNFRTRTPKGDGNKLKEINTELRDEISEHEPRKGTETSG